MQDTITKQVTVTVAITNQDGQTETFTKTINGGPTRVSVLKGELGVDEDSSLWVIDKAGKKKPLADHQTYDVKQDDHFEALVKGGVS